jgi:methyltransferase (TIGR00027 family)
MQVTFKHTTEVRGSASDTCDETAKNVTNLAGIVLNSICCRTMTIEHISDTARWVAIYRAMESERPDAHFRDPWARTLAGASGEKIAATMKGSQQMAWAMIVRTQVIDEIILGAIKNDGIDMIVNLAAGLDTRPWRLPMPKALRWIDVDLPDILQYKLDLMQGETPVCSYEAVKTDLREVETRRALFARLASESKRALVVTEGLLVYLQPDQVGTLAADLAAQPSFRTWIIDLVHPKLLVMMQRQLDKSDVRGDDTKFNFAPEDGTKFFEPFGWKEGHFYGSMVEARRLNREMRGAWLWRLLGNLGGAKRRAVFRRFSGIVRLERIA